MPDSKQVSIFKEELFANRTALVTGGGSGIGLSIAQEFCRLGAKVAICGRDTEKLEVAANELRMQFGERISWGRCDIRDEGEVKSFVASTNKRWQGIDFLINNAGGQFPSPAENISASGFAAVVSNNLCGTFNMTREVAREVMIPAQGGTIVNIIANIYRGFPGMAHTGAARAGVENMSMSLAVEWARYGIRVNSVAPGIVLSSGTKQYPKALLDRAISQCPMGRAAIPEEVAASVLFLCSPMAAFITGTTLRVDGGQALAGDTFEFGKAQTAKHKPKCEESPT